LRRRTLLQRLKIIRHEQETVPADAPTRALATVRKSSRPNSAACQTRPQEPSGHDHDERQGVRRALRLRVGQVTLAYALSCIREGARAEDPEVLSLLPTCQRVVSRRSAPRHIVVLATEEPEWRVRMRGGINEIFEALHEGLSRAGLVAVACDALPEDEGQVHLRERFTSPQGRQIQPAGRIRLTQRRVLALTLIIGSVLGIPAVASGGPFIVEDDNRKALPRDEPYSVPRVAASAPKLGNLRVVPKSRRPTGRAAERRCIYPGAGHPPNLAAAGSRRGMYAICSLAP